MHNIGCTSRRRCAERITQARKTSKPRSPWRVRRTSDLQWTPVDWRGTGREHGRAARVADDGPRQRPALHRRALELPRILTCPSRGDSPPASPTGVLLRELTNLVSDHLYGQCRSADRHPWLSDMPGNHTPIEQSVDQATWVSQAHRSGFLHRHSARIVVRKPARDEDKAHREQAAPTSIPQA